MAKKLTSKKARKILHDKSVHGKPLTDKQRRFFGAIAGGAEPYKAESGGWLDKYDAPKAQNGIEGTMGGLTDKGFNYNGAWGGPSMQTGGNIQPAMAGAVQTVPMAQLGDSIKPIPMQLAMGGSIPGAVGFTYARTQSPAPANGPYAKKTKASAQDGEVVMKGKEFVENWMSSPMYKEMLEKSAQGPELERISKGRVAGLNIPTVTSKDLSLRDTGTMGTHSRRVRTILNATPSEMEEMMGILKTAAENPKNKEARRMAEKVMMPTVTGWNIGLNPILKPGTLQYEATLAHEHGHATDTPFIGEDLSKMSLEELTKVKANVQKPYIPESDIQKMKQYQEGKVTTDYGKYISDPRETRQFLNEVRYLGKTQGVYDPFTEKITPEQYKKIKPLEQTDPMRSLREIYTDEQIVDMLNSISKTQRASGVPIAQNGQEMKYYQEGLDFKPKTISQDGVRIDPMGYWNPENVGEPVIIPSNVITMEGVDQPLIGISDTGDIQYMEPGEDYEFDGESVLEMPVAQKGVTQPSRADSVILLKNAIAKDLFYNNPNYRAISHDRNPTLLTRKGLQELARESVKYNTDPYFRNNPDMIVGGQEDDPTRFIVKAKDLIKKTGRVKGSNIIYQAPDVITGVDTYFNPAAPPNYFSPQILPQGVKTYYSDKYRDRASAPYYEPLAVTPWDMLTEKQKDLRLKKYGVTGTPYANRNKGPKKQWSLNPLVPSFERTPISIMQPNLTPGPIPTIERPVIEIPQEVPVQEEAPTTKKGKAEREKKTPVRDFLQELKWKMEDRKMRRQTERGTKRQLRCWSGVCFDDEGNIAEAEYGGYLPKAQNGKRVPIVVSDPKDPRLKAYNDSLYTYKKGFELAGKLGSIFDKEYGYDKTTKEYKKRLQNLYEGKTGKYTWNTPSAGRMSDKEIQKEINYYDKLNNYEKQVASVLKEYLKLPVKNFTASYSPELPTVLRYKKPVQPVEYEAPQRDTLYVSDPNDPRLRAYNDSLNLYKAYKMQDKLMGPGSKVSDEKLTWTTDDLKKGREKKIIKGLEHYGPLAEDFQSEQDQFKDGFGYFSGRRQDKRLLDYYKSLGFKPNQIMYHSSPDIVSDKIKAIGSYFDGTALSPIYKKPVQPVVYERPAPQMSPVFMDRRQMQPMSPNLTATPISQVNRPRGGYMVQYKDIDESGKLVPKQMYFQTPQQADDYMQARIKAGIMYGGSMQRSGVDINRGPFEFGGEIPVAKQGVSVNNADAQPLKKLDQLLNFTNYNKPTRGGWLDKYK